VPGVVQFRQYFITVTQSTSDREMPTRYTSSHKGFFVSQLDWLALRNSPKLPGQST